MAAKFTEVEISGQEKEDTVQANMIEQGDCNSGGIYVSDLGDLTWSFWDTGELIITGNGKMANFPESELYNRSWAKYKDRIKKITVEEGVTSLGDLAFADLKNLSSVSLPQSLKSIGSAQFFDDTNLEEILIPSSVTEIGSSIFISAGKLDLKSEGYSGNVIIKGYKNSYAETYAKENNIKFIVVEENENAIENPRIEEDSSMESGQKVTWDCVWFGNYPQSEITSSDTVYSELQNATEWDANNDIVVDGNRYRRMKAGDAVYATNAKEGCYEWSDSTTYHYFKYEPIKWRVLNVSNGQALLLADVVLDNQKYNLNYIRSSWENSSIRSWLNGYASSFNEPNQDYTDKNFINFAFSNIEQEAINERNINDYGIKNLQDKIFLLSTSDVYNTDEAKSYGFVKDEYAFDEGRRSKSSTYAKAMGVSSETSAEYKDNCAWWLCSLYAIAGVGEARVSCVLTNGVMYLQGSNIDNYVIGVRPALELNLSDTELYSYAGTVCSDGTENEVELQHLQDSQEEEKSILPYLSKVKKYMKNLVEFAQDVIGWIEKKLDYWLYIKR